MMMFATTLCLFVSLASLPPLTEADLVQLQSAEDFGSRDDEAAIYPLLRNALQWDAELVATGRAPGAMIPDYAGIASNPEPHRGQLFLLEGRLVDDPRANARLSRPGPWDGKLQQWTIQWGKGIDDVAVIYMVDPQGTFRKDDQVQLVARFYKVWRSPYLIGRKTDPQPKDHADFLTFVGRDAHHLGAVIPFMSQSQGSGNGMTRNMMVLPVALLIGLLFLWYRMRKFTAGKPSLVRETLERHRARRQTDQAQDDDADEEPPLPKDPVEALEELQRRHTQRTGDDSSQP